MTIQIAVRLPDDTVHGLDEAVGSGHARSRAEFVDRAVRRELRRQRAIDELPLLPGVSDDDPDEFAELARHAGATPLPLD